MKRLAIRMLLGFLGRDLTLADRNLLISGILDGLDALPLRDTIVVSEAGLVINGRLAEIDELKVLYTSAKMALDNKALKLINDQVLWNAIKEGLHNGDDPVKLLFYRSAIWFGEQQKIFLQTLAGERPGTPPQEEI